MGKWLVFFGLALLDLFLGAISGTFWWGLMSLTGIPILATGFGLFCGGVTMAVMVALQCQKQEEVCEEKERTALIYV
jgi:hypothetical protein